VGFRSVLLTTTIALTACGGGGASSPAPDHPTPTGDAAAPDARPPRPAEDRLGAVLDAARSVVRFKVWSSRATAMEVDLYAAPFGEDERIAAPLVRDEKSNVWSVEIPLADVSAKGIGTIYYGYRAWGPNWPRDPAWTKGSRAGFVADVDDAGNRFDPNKLLLDPYAREMSHDPRGPRPAPGGVFDVGDAHRADDSGRYAPKGIVLEDDAPNGEGKPTRALADDVIYEVHVRGLTMQDPSVPVSERGTYAGAARKAAYLRDLGVTAIELLPIHETQNDANDPADGTAGDNYWGYSSLSYFAPDRRYASDKSPGGPTRELREMVRAMHAEGIKVFLDVVYNHTGEGGGQLLSWRGLDNAAYYELANDPRAYVNTNGVSANFNTAHPAVRDLILASLRYYAEKIGVDGFRFDLAPVLGNSCERGCFTYDKGAADNAMNRAVRELPARAKTGGPGVDLIAEPWAIGQGSYQIGNFPAGWSEWNDHFRDAVRRSQNKLDVVTVTPREMLTRMAGSPDLFADDGRGAHASINYVVSHDGFCLRDLYSYNEEQNGQPWPFGPSPGGDDDNKSWDHGGDAQAQVRAARTGMTLLMLAAGTPMLTGGDEMFRTQYGNNNPYNLDSEKIWLDWADLERNASFFSYVRGVIALRRAHPALRPADQPKPEALRANGTRADDAALGDGAQHFLALRIDGSKAADPARSIYLAYNWSTTGVAAALPSPSAGASWYLAASSADAKVLPLGGEEPHPSLTLDVPARSVVVAVER
jgi:glycogen operon protein